jgi:hypothetical protein
MDPITTAIIAAVAAEPIVRSLLLAAFVQRAEPDPAARPAVETVLLAEGRRLNEAGYPAPLLAWQPHLRAVTGAASGQENERAAGLCHELGYHLHMFLEGYLDQVGQGIRRETKLTPLRFSSRLF